MCGTLTIEAKAEEESSIRKTIDDILTQHLKRSIIIPFGTREEARHYTKGIINFRHASIYITRQEGRVQITMSTDGFDTRRYSQKGGIREEKEIHQKVKKAIIGTTRQEEQPIITEY